MEKKRINILIFYTVQIIVSSVLQGALRILPKFYGQLPLLLLSFALTVAVFEDMRTAITLGIISGVIMDVLQGPTIGLNLICCFLGCFLIKSLFDGLIKRKFFIVFLIISLVILVITMIQFVFNYVMQGYGSNFEIFKMKYFPRMIYTILVVPFFYLINLRIDG